MKKTNWDVFISHASEDKDDIARPLADCLTNLGLKVWFDELSIQLGDSINNKVNDGLANSRIGVVIISKSFLSKNWTNIELGVLNFNTRNTQKKLIPVLYNIGFGDVSKQLPFLADIKGAVIESNIKEIAKQIFNVNKLLESESELYINMNDLSLDNIAVIFRNTQNQRLNLVAQQLELLSSLVDIDIESSILKIRMILNIISCETLILSNKSYSSETAIDEFRCVDLINNNILEHINVITRFSDCVMNDNGIGCTSLNIHYDLCKLSITAILNWFYNNFIRNNPPQKRVLSIVEVQNFTEEDIIESFKIEQLVLRPDLISPIEIVNKWYSHNNYTMLGVRDNSTGKTGWLY